MSSVQKRFGGLAALLPLIAFGVFMASVPAQAGQMLVTTCYWAGEEYSYGACADTDCCTFCFNDDQKCIFPFGSEQPYWDECGSC